ncbi:3-keto-disaccharide hydrolase [Larkinella rosea]|uniref:DUF1080 domain-containing protein n=1 Tax=Larkinella rosea TaxID=2025312 RepID=A0A3P1C0F7_9BACT|nr:DUF1080 domain-containing protein [Larkinella rosea]RRB06689.1 DUF1080 domain-containing protein [Larkinella rosea]
MASFFHKLFRGIKQRKKEVSGVSLLTSANLRLALRYSLFSLVFHPAFAQKKDPNKEEWISLFNGKDLSGWDIKVAGEDLNVNYKNTFRAEDGMIRIMYDQYKTFDNKYGHIYYKDPYSYYILKFDYRFLGDQVPGGASWNVRNSGVMIHSQSAKSLTKDQDFPISLEIQTLGGLGKGVRHTANLCTPGTIVEMGGKVIPDHCIDSQSKTYDGDQWVSVTAVVLGDSIIHHIIEGDTVLTYEKTKVGGGYISKQNDFASGHVGNPDYWLKRDNTPLKEGYIALQSESHAIDFKNIELLNLKGCMVPGALNYKSYYRVADNSKCEFKKR